LENGVKSERGTWDEVREEAADLLSLCASRVPWQFFIGGATSAGDRGKIHVKLEYEVDASRDGGNVTLMGEVRGEEEI
jgi:hypothetical protein